MKTRILLIILALLVFASVASAADVYVAQSATGLNTGASCVNARAVSSLGAGDWSPGNTIHLCGVITSAIIGIGSGGTSSNPITVKAEAGAGISVASLSTSGQIDVSGMQWVILDGGGGFCGFVAFANVACSQGYIQATANGSGLAHQDNSMAINANNTTNVEIKGWLIANVYVHSSLSDTATSRTWCIQGYSFPTNLSIHNNTMHDVGWCLDGGGPGLQFYDNEVYHMDHGVGTGGPITTGVGVKIHHNHFHDMANWDTTADSYHHDGVHVFTDGGAIPNVWVYDNLFDGDMGNNVTTWLYPEASNGAMDNRKVFNNVGYFSSSRNSCCGFPTAYTDGGTSNNIIMANNTTYGPGGVGPTGNQTNGFLVKSGQSGATVANNVSAVGTGNIAGIDTGAGISVIENNAYNSGAGGNSFSYHGSIFSSFTLWESSTGETTGLYDTLAHFNLSGTGAPQSGSTLCGAGANLTSLGIAELDTDILGNTRPATGAWDAGAFNCGSSTTGISFSPTSLSFGSVNVGTTSASQSTTVTNTGTTTITGISISITGTNPSDFAFTTTCSTTLLPSLTCTITATFTPTATGSRSANISVADSVAGSPQLVPLSGTGLTAVVTPEIVKPGIVFIP